MNTNSPEVSIVMATFSRAHLILRALQSIQAQSFSNWECLIIDDGSTDNTKQVIKGLLDTDKRFKYYERPPRFKKGLPGARNFGLELASGDFYVFFDDDDVVHSRNLEINMQVLKDQEDYKFCRYDKQPFFDSEPFSGEMDNGKDFTVSKIDVTDIERVITGELPFASCTVMWSRECFESDRFNEDLQYAEEWELYTRILSKGYKGASIDKVLYYNRKHALSNTGEFWDNNKERMDSKVKATRLILTNLKDKSLLSESMIRYFIRLSIFLKKPRLLNFILENSGIGPAQKLKYKIGYRFYPILRPIFLMKDKLIKFFGKEQGVF